MHVPVVLILIYELHQGCFKSLVHPFVKSLSRSFCAKNHFISCFSVCVFLGDVGGGGSAKGDQISVLADMIPWRIEYTSGYDLRGIEYANGFDPGG